MTGWMRRNTGERRACSARGKAVCPIRRILRLLAAVAIAAASASAALAAESSDSPRIAIELNRLQEVEGACRLSFVFVNHLPHEVAALAIETVLFNSAGQVDRLLVLKSRPLTPGKIRAQQFDVPGMTCAGIGRVLVNDVTDCKAGDLTPAQCLERIEPTSRAGTPFVSTD